MLLKGDVILIKSQMTISILGNMLMNILTKIRKGLISVLSLNF